MYIGQARSDLVRLGQQFWMDHVRHYVKAYKCGKLSGKGVTLLLDQFQSFERPAWPTAAELQAANLPWAVDGPSSYPDDQFFFEVNGLVELDPLDVVSDIRQPQPTLNSGSTGTAIPRAGPSHSASASPPPLSSKHKPAVASSAGPTSASSPATNVPSVGDGAAATPGGALIPTAVSLASSQSIASSVSSLHRIVDHQTTGGEVIPLLCLDVLKNGVVTSVAHLPMSAPYISRYFSTPVSKNLIDKIRNKFKKRYVHFYKRFVEVEGYEHLYKRYTLSTKRHNQPAFVPVFCLEEIMRDSQS